MQAASDHSRARRSYARADSILRALPTGCKPPMLRRGPRARRFRAAIYSLRAGAIMRGPAPAGLRRVAQTGRALPSGGRGRRFKSCLSDQLRPTLCGQCERGPISWHRTDPQQRAAAQKPRSRSTIQKPRACVDQPCRLLAPALLQIALPRKLRCLARRPQSSRIPAHAAPCSARRVMRRRPPGAPALVQAAFVPGSQTGSRRPLAGSLREPGATSSGPGRSSSFAHSRIFGRT